MLTFLLSIRIIFLLYYGQYSAVKFCREVVSSVISCLSSTVRYMFHFYPLFLRSQSGCEEVESPGNLQNPHIFRRGANCFICEDVRGRGCLIAGRPWTHSRNERAFNRFSRLESDQTRQGFSPADLKVNLTGLEVNYANNCSRAELHIPVIANGNIQYFADVTRCLSETNVNAVMSAEGHLHNPAIFVGSQPSVYSICLEYLECAKTYPTSISIVRGHVFKLSHHALNEHPSFRQLIGLAQDTDELSEVIRQMQKTCSECSTNRDINLPYPHWICQPYERPKSEHSLAADRQFGADPENISELSCTPKDPLSCKLILQEERRSRRDAKQKAKAAKRVAARSKNSLCNRCQSNLRGAQCPSMACRSCCWTLDPKRVSQCAG
ncbi:hypothetical protein EG68_09923 [Paragonimus skrjabini miyazakii]|uniref:DUS-like FMN-binding domain-containing protein n=1 Tax=Paragonimus skrjabini miyazakii TaxID=59628 RepID=A0A8S9YLS9_9TREM|nr:hypothetical protein EG68_09923 [Paragonimus skrjabini miyazakii]